MFEIKEQRGPAFLDNRYLSSSPDACISYRCDEL
jgi:hypothetical protein